MKKHSFAAALLVLVFPVLTGQSIDSENSVVTITAYHGDESPVEATMTGMTGSLEFDPENIEQATFDVCVDPSTYKSDNFMRNWHIKTNQYLGAGKFPQICFTSKQVIGADEIYVVTGDLTLRGISRQVSIPFSYEDGVLEGTMEINRLDYNVGNDNEKRVAPKLDIRIRCVLN